MAPTGVGRLLNHKKEQRPDLTNVVAIGNTAVERMDSSAGSTHPVEACRAALANTLSLLLQRLLNAPRPVAGDGLLHAEALRILQGRAVGIERAFEHRVVARFEALCRGDEDSTRPPAEAPPATDMRLAEEGGLEEFVAVNKLVSGNEARYAREQQALELRFSHMLHGTPIDVANNPIAPAAVCGAFRDAIGPYVASVAVKLAIYRLFDEHFMGGMGELYAEINSILATAGRMPGPSAAPNSGQRRCASPSAGHQAPRPGIEEPVSRARGSKTLNHLRELLAQIRAASVSPSSHQLADLPGPAMERSRLIEALNALQRQRLALVAGGDQTASMGAKGLKQRVLQLARNADPGASINKLASIDEDIIEVMVIFFERLAGQLKLSDEMASILAPLQIPLLKLVLMDRSFFDQADHPVRRLLDNLLGAAVGWNEEEGRSADGLYAQIMETVDRLVRDFDRDADVVSGLNAEFEAYLDKERRAIRVAEARTRQVARGKAQLGEARKRVAIEFAARLDLYAELPEVVDTLFREGWRDVLVLSYLRKGVHSRAWERDLELIDRVIWSICPKIDHTERQELLAAIPVLFRDLRTGLSASSYPRHKMAALFQGLEAIHLGILRAGSGEPSDSPHQAFEGSSIFRRGLGRPFHPGDGCPCAIRAPTSRHRPNCGAGIRAPELLGAA